MSGAHLLRNVSLFANLSISELDPLAQRLIARRYQAGETIFSQGSPGNSLYIVKSGLVAIAATDGAGQTQTLAKFGPGQGFGEFALLDGLPRSAGAMAEERSDLLVLARPEFFMYLEERPAVAINLLVLLSRRLRFAVQFTEHENDQGLPIKHLAGILVQLAERYGNPENETVRLPLRLTQGELAGMMGRTRSETQAALDALQQQELVEVQGLQMTVRDLEALRAVS